MQCQNCGIELAPGTAYCPNCGAMQNIQQYVQAQQPVASRPALQLPTERSLLKMIFLGIITLGIYAIVIQSRISSEINIVASRYDEKRTIPFLAAFWIMYITFFIYGFIWNHQFSERIGTELRRRGHNYSFGASDYWLWGVLGSLIIVGPFVYCYKLLKSMNMINASYNIYG